MTEHDMLLMVQRQRAALVAERDALREQVAAVVAERDALREAIEDARRLLATARTVGGSPDCVLAAEDVLIVALGSLMCLLGKGGGNGLHEMWIAVFGEIPGVEGLWNARRNRPLSTCPSGRTRTAARGACAARSFGKRTE